jgi:hypothetical protein
MYKKLVLVGLLSVVAGITAPVYAQSLHHQLKDQKHQVHDAANSGMISTQQHQMLDGQRNAQHAAVDNRYPVYSGTGYLPNAGYNNGNGYADSGYVNGGPVNGYGMSGAGHINDPNYNPGHNNSLGHKLQDAINPAGTVPAYGVPGVAPGYGYGYQGAPAVSNHVNSPYVNPGHDGSIQHQMNDAVNGNQQILPGHIPVSNYGQQGYGSNYGQQGQGHGNGHGHSH